MSLSDLGYQKAQVAVNGKSKIDIVLKDEDKTLNEVVVVGYGTMKKRD